MAMTEPLERVRKGRAAGLALAVAAATWGLRARGRARGRKEALAEEERKQEALAEEERKAQWEAEAPERLRRQQESKERERRRHEEFLAAGEAKGWRYEDLGRCQLEKGKKRFATKLDAQICTWVQHKKHGGPLQRAYRCDGDDAPDGDGCGSWHLTSKSFFI